MYRDQTKRRDRQPKLSEVIREKEEYWENNKEGIREERAAKKAEHKRTYSREPGKPRQSIEEKKERQRNYYQNNKERCKEVQQSWRQRNRERARELANKYAQEAREKKQQEVNNHDALQPSPFLVAITKNGCNVCGKGYPLYNFRNEETKYYTGCLCASCLNSYNNMNKDASIMFKLREYVLARVRANEKE